MFLKNDQNINELVVRAGLAKVEGLNRGQDQLSIYIKQLVEAEEHARNKKLGIHSERVIKKHKSYTDYSRQEFAVKAQKFYDYIKNEKTVMGVVELVLNGSRYKVRLDQFNCYVMVKLQAVKTLMYDPNYPEYQVWSNAAKEYAKDNILQRDIRLDIATCDRRGNFIANIMMGKNNFTHDLLRNGFAHVFKIGRIPPKLIEGFETLEAEAKTAKKGIWSTDIKVEQSTGRRGEVVELKGKAKDMMMTDMVDATEFYYQNPASPDLEKVECLIDDFNGETAQHLKTPLNQGTPCMAKYAADDKWYRGRVLRTDRKGPRDHYTIFFIDYGNQASTALKDLRRIPKKLANIPALCTKATLAYVRVCGIYDQFGSDAAEYFRNKTWDMKLSAKPVFQVGRSTHVLVYPKGKTSEPKYSIQYLMLKKGFARMSEQFTIPAELKEVFAKAEETAQDKKLGVWKFGGDFEEEAY